MAHNGLLHLRLGGLKNPKELDVRIIFILLLQILGHIGGQCKDLLRKYLFKRWVFTSICIRFFNYNPFV